MEGPAQDCRRQIMGKKVRRVKLCSEEDVFTETIHGKKCGVGVPDLECVDYGSTVAGANVAAYSGSNRVTI